MSKRRQVKERLSTLGEIDGIMVAMKNLALLEMRRLETFLSTQRRAVSSIEAAAQDFLSFFPETVAHPGSTRQLLLVIGSERGFCGDFNEALLAPLGIAMEQEDALPVVVGRRLENKLQDDKRIAAFVEGPSVAEEVPAALVRLTGVLDELQRQRPEEAWSIGALYHDGESGAVRKRQLLPLTVPEKTGPTYAHPPLLNLEPARFLSQLTEQYLYGALHEVFYASMMAENRKRLEHMENAIRRLEKDESVLRLRYNALRQEEIIEEIEIIMLSAEALTGKDD